MWCKNKSLTDKDIAKLIKFHEQAAAYRAKRVHKTKWHKWFAWYPIRLGNNDCRWFEYVERRIDYGTSVVPWAFYDTYYGEIYGRDKR